MTAPIFKKGIFRRIIALVIIANFIFTGIPVGAYTLSPAADNLRRKAKRGEIELERGKIYRELITAGWVRILQANKELLELLDDNGENIEYLANRLFFKIPDRILSLDNIRQVLQDEWDSLNLDDKTDERVEQLTRVIYSSFPDGGTTPQEELHKVLNELIDISRANTKFVKLFGMDLRIEALGRILHNKAIDKDERITAAEELRKIGTYDSILVLRLYFSKMSLAEVFEIIEKDELAMKVYNLLGNKLSKISMVDDRDSILYRLNLEEISLELARYLSTFFPETDKDSVAKLFLQGLYQKTHRERVLLNNLFANKSVTEIFDEKPEEINLLATLMLSMKGPFIISNIQALLEQNRESFVLIDEVLTDEGFIEEVLLTDDQIARLAAAIATSLTGTTPTDGGVLSTDLAREKTEEVERVKAIQRWQEMIRRIADLTRQAPQLSNPMYYLTSVSTKGATDVTPEMVELTRISINMLVELTESSLTVNIKNILNEYGYPLDKEWCSVDPAMAHKPIVEVGGMWVGDGGGELVPVITAQDHITKTIWVDPGLVVFARAVSEIDGRLPSEAELRELHRKEHGRVYNIVISLKDLVGRSPEGVMYFQSMIEKLSGKGNIKVHLHFIGDNMTLEEVNDKVDDAFEKINAINKGYTSISRDMFETVVTGSPEQIAERVKDVTGAGIFLVIGPESYTSPFDSVIRIVLNQADKGKMTWLSKAFKLSLALIPKDGKITEDELKKLDALFSIKDGNFHVGSQEVITDVSDAAKEYEQALDKADIGI